MGYEWEAVSKEILQDEIFWRFPESVIILYLKLYLDSDRNWRHYAVPSMVRAQLFKWSRNHDEIENQIRRDLCALFRRGYVVFDHPPIEVNERNLDYLTVRKNRPTGIKTERGRVRHPPVNSEDIQRGYNPFTEKAEPEEETPTREAPPIPDDDIPEEFDGLELYLADKKLIRAWPTLKKSLKQAYPRVNIQQELAKSHTWQIARPERRKKNNAKYLDNWMKNASKDKANGANPQSSTRYVTPPTAGDKHAGR